MPNTISTAKKKVLNDIFMLYWKWDTQPDFDNVEENSPEYLLLQMYDSLKADCLSQYNFRSTIKYVELTGEEPTTNDDPRYKYRANVPEDFLKAVGFWADKERHQPIMNSVDIQNFKAKTNYPKVIMAYTSKSVDESVLDNWVLEYMAIYMANKASDIGGCSDSQKQYLEQKAMIERNLCGNRDLEMAHQDRMTSLNQFLEEWY